MKFYSLDRFEEDFAVLVDDNGACVNVQKSELPINIKAGNVLCYENGKYMLAPDEEAARRSRIKSLQNKLFKK